MKKKTHRGSDLPTLSITWGEIKAKIESAGVKDEEKVFLIDIGPGEVTIYAERDRHGFLEISSDLGRLTIPPKKKFKSSLLKSTA
jgi:hypothetical protein